MVVCQLSLLLTEVGLLIFLYWVYTPSGNGWTCGFSHKTTYSEGAGQGVRVGVRGQSCTCQALCLNIKLLA